MSVIAESCFLQSVEDSRVRIDLPHDLPIIVGRNKYSLILDKQVSRRQMVVKSDYKTKTVKGCPMGINASGLNGFMLLKEHFYNFNNGDRVEIVLGCHIYTVVFKMPSKESEDGQEPPFKKQKFFSIFDKENKGSIDDKNLGRWETLDKDLLVFTPSVARDNAAVAAFDMDGTIIKTKSGNRFPTDNSDWTPLFSNVVRKLNELHSNGYRLVIFTNQLKIGQNRNLIPEFKKKIELIAKEFHVPFNVFIAMGQGVYRKPCMGMWNTMLKYMENVDMEKSFYVGDAAGREKNWAPHKPKDHSIADRLFALNIGLKFYTPEEYFLGTRNISYLMPEFDPKSVVSFEYNAPLSSEQEVIVMVGSQASGKSFFCMRYVVPYGYVRVNRDTLYSKQRCLVVMENTLREKHSVIVDNTNPTVESRKPYIQLARKFNLPCRCFLMDVSLEHAKHNNKFRGLTDNNHAQIGDILLNSYNKQYEEPSVNEGFSEVLGIKFNPSFENDEQEKLYRMYLLGY